MDATGEDLHRERMQRKKSVVDAAIARATWFKGPLDMRMRSIIISWYEHSCQIRAAAKCLGGRGDPRHGRPETAAGER